MAKSDDLEELLEDEDFGEGLDEKPSKTSEAQATGNEVEEDIEPEEIEEAPSPRFRDILSQRNINVPDDVDEAEYLGQMLDRFTSIGQQHQQMLAERQQYQNQLLQYQHLLSQQQKPQPEPTQQKPPEPTGLLAHWKKVPEWQDAWLQLVKRNEQNEIVPINGAAPDLPQRIRERQLWEEQAQRLFFENPQQFIYEALQTHPEFQKIGQFQTQSQQDFLAYQDKVEADRIAAQRRPHLYQTDAQGNSALTTAGQAYLAAVQDATEMFARKGIQADSAMLDSIGWRAALPYAIQAQEQAKKPVETPSQKKKAKQLEFGKQAAAKTANKNRKSKPQERLGDEYARERHIMAQFREAGIDPHALAEV